MSDTWIIVIAFVIGGAIILGRLAWVHRIPGLSRRMRKLGPLPRDRGMPKPPEIGGETR